MKWGNVQLLVWLPLAIPLAWALFALLRRRRRALAQLVDVDLLPALLQEQGMVVAVAKNQRADEDAPLLPPQHRMPQRGRVA